LAAIFIPIDNPATHGAALAARPPSLEIALNAPVLVLVANPQAGARVPRVQNLILYHKIIS